MDMREWNLGELPTGRGASATRWYSPPSQARVLSYLQVVTALWMSEACARSRIQ
jgi:hypothetical protein